MATVKAWPGISAATCPRLKTSARWQMRSTSSKSDEISKTASPLRSDDCIEAVRSDQLGSAYAFRRVLLIIPTLFAIMVVNFVIVQAAPADRSS